MISIRNTIFVCLVGILVLLLLNNALLGKTNFFLSLISILFGGLILFVFYHLDYHNFCNPHFYLGLTLIVLISLFLNLVPGIGASVNGARRWIILGNYNFEPCDLTPACVVILLSALIADKQNMIKSFIHGFLPPMFITLVFSVLLLASRNVQTTRCIFMCTLVLLFIAGARKIHIFSVLFCFALDFFILISLYPHRVERITSFLPTWKYTQSNGGWQLIQSLSDFALGSDQSSNYSATNINMVSCSTEHEITLSITLLILPLLIAMAISFIIIINNSPDYYGKLLASGISSIFLIEWFTGIFQYFILHTKYPSIPFANTTPLNQIVSLSLLGILLSINYQSIYLHKNKIRKRFIKKHVFKTTSN